MLSFFILHLLVYPSSNGYNSYMDRDEGPIGGLIKPLLPTLQLFHATVAMDALAVFLSLFVGLPFAAGIFLYIIVSRAYSNRSIRLKQYPLIGFFTVFFFQGAFILFLTLQAAAPDHHPPSLQSALTASLLIGALYPLTQVYQHLDDEEDGVRTISMVLGKRGSFIFSGLFFTAATVLLAEKFNSENRMQLFYVYTALMLPVITFFLYWAMRVWKNGSEANFRNSLIMNCLSTFCTSVFFIILIKLSH